MKRQLLGLAILVAIPVVAFAQPKGAPPPPTVVAEPAREQTLAPTALILGTVMPPRKTIVGSAVEGRIEEVPVRDGDPVTGPMGKGAERVPGQTLAQVLTETIKIELKGAEAELKLRTHDLEQIKIAQEDVVQAESRHKAAEALRLFANSKLERAEALFKQNRGITKQDLDEAISVAEAAEQAFRGAASNFKSAQDGHPEKVAAAEAKLAVQQEEVNRINDRLRKYTVRAPFDGYVAALHTEIGAWIKQGEPVAEIIELSHVDIVVAVPESYIAFARKSAPSEVTVDALPGETFAGKVAQVVPQADLRSRTFPVKIRVENQVVDGIPLLKAGMLARARLAVGSQERGTVVRRDALVLDKENKYVFVAAANPESEGDFTVRREKVTTGASDGTFVVIHGNVKPGELVVVEGNERLRDKQKVKVKVLEK